MAQPNDLFPSIGSLAEQADQLPDDDAKQDSTSGADDAEGEERPLQEIESLCMKCGEQVSPLAHC